MPAVAEDDDIWESVLNTYRYLRGGMVVWVLMLLIAIGLQIKSARCLEESLSAYYYTGAHAIFIVTLCALGVSLIVYKGSSDTEDVLLNLAGILAFIVAMAPTTLTDGICGGPGLPSGFVVTATVRDNVWAVIAALVIAKLIVLRVLRGKPAHPTTARRVVRVVFWSVLVAGFGIFVAVPDLFERIGHVAAAVLMFLAITAVVWINGVQARGEHSPRKHRVRPAVYKTIAVVMIAVLLAGLAAAFLDVPYWALVVESVLIGAFAVFWILQTIDLWDVVDRTPLMAPDAPGRSL